MVSLQWMQNNLCVGVLGLLLAACGGGDSPAAPAAPVTTAPAVTVTSNRADLVSGGDAMVEVAVPAGASGPDVRVDVDGRDVTAQFAVRPNGKYAGVVSDLANGVNQLSARVNGGPATTVSVTNFSKDGPLLYGPQVSPWSCDAGATDTNCNRPVSYSYRYMSTNPALTTFLTYDPANPPTDVKTTTTDEGKTVPFIVRVETGVQGRDYYNVAVLFDPTKPWTPYEPQAGWNGKVRFHHGFGLGLGFAQSNTTSTAQLLSSPHALGKGYLVANAALNVNNRNANVATQAEAMIMLKERIAETYGPIKLAFGYGSSGGSIVQYQMANAYPGIYDGIIVNATFPDSVTIMVEVEDCSLLTKYFTTHSTVAWNDAEMAAASGHPSTGVCAQWSGFKTLYDPAVKGTNCDVPNVYLYDAVLNPNGVRCTLQDYMIGVMGRSPVTGFAYRPYGNNGVQYGLSALLGGSITPAQFVDLNGRIGSHDIEYAWRAGRITADTVAVQNSYRSGAVNAATHLNKVAILDLRPLDLTGIHHQYRAWSTRERIRAAQGSIANHALWYYGASPTPQNEAHDVMDAWLTAVIADTGSGTRAQKLVTRKPASATDRCNGTVGAIASMLACTGAPDGSTRMAAGEGFADDILSCQLKPMDRTSYPGVTFTDPQWAQLQAAFPAGVCDYSKPGIGQQSTVAWQRYVRPDGTAVMGGEAMPAAPVGNDGGLAARGF